MRECWLPRGRERRPAHARPRPVGWRQVRRRHNPHSQGRCTVTAGTQVVTLLHRNCITAPPACEWCRDYQHVCREGNPLALSFVEYVAARLSSLGPRTFTSTGCNDVTWYPASCGHQHPWGQPCGSW